MPVSISERLDAMEDVISSVGSILARLEQRYGIGPPKPQSHLRLVEPPAEPPRRFESDEVLVALETVVEPGGKPIGAGTVAQAIVGADTRLTHSDRIRVGLALSKLARGGQVVKHEPKNDHLTCAWALPKCSRPQISG